MIVQFIHPGEEHTKNTGTNWNNSSHKRKYIEINGRFLENLTDKPKSDTLYFWGEWEAQSYASITNKNPPLPRWLFTPYYSLPNGIANTDPFVFGDQFYYCICKQGHYTSLRNLNTGDVLLFGSCINKQFVIDTVFVVKDFVEFEVSQIPLLRDKYNETFYDVSLTPINKTLNVACKKILEVEGLCIPVCGDDEDDNKPTNQHKKYRIYSAVMYDDRDRFDGMFSYAPCLTSDKGKRGFARPAISNSAIITDNLTQGIKITNNINQKDVWQSVTQQVLNNGLSLLISNELPNKTV